MFCTSKGALLDYSFTSQFRSVARINSQEWLLGNVEILFFVRVRFLKPKIMVMQAMRYIQGMRWKLHVVARFNYALLLL